MGLPLAVTRRHNLLALYQAFVQQAVAHGGTARGVDQDFAAKLEISPSMLSQIKSARTIGDKLARQIESHCGKAPNWLDQVGPPPDPQPDPAEEDFIALARSAWRSATPREKQALSLLLRTPQPAPPADLPPV